VETESQDLLPKGSRCEGRRRTGPKGPGGLAGARCREIQEGVNVAENWNSANYFILYGWGGEIATIRLEDQVITMLALHLLEVSLLRGRARPRFGRLKAGLVLQQWVLYICNIY
jgi:hypothetical protein